MNETQSNRPCSQSSLSRRARLAAALAIGLALASGCVSLEPLREQRYAEITIPQLEAAGHSDDERVFDGLVGLLELRLDDPDAVELDHALEAIAALIEIDRSEATPILSRCAREGSDEELRYMAVEALVRLDADGARELIGGIADSDPSELVREHASEWLASPDESARASPGAQGGER